MAREFRLSLDRISRYDATHFNIWWDLEEKTILGNWKRVKSGDRQDIINYLKTYLFDEIIFSLADLKQRGPEDLIPPDKVIVKETKL